MEPHKNLSKVRNTRLLIFFVRIQKVDDKESQAKGKYPDKSDL